MKNLPTFNEFINESLNREKQTILNQITAMNGGKIDEETLDVMYDKVMKYSHEFVKRGEIDTPQLRKVIEEISKSNTISEGNKFSFSVKLKENGDVSELILKNPELFEEEDEEDDTVDIDIELEDETGKALDDDEEEGVEERARPPRLTKRMRKANNVKATATKKILGPDSPIRGKIEKIFLLVKKEIRKEASKQGVPIGQINLDKITIKR